MHDGRSISRHLAFTAVAVGVAAIAFLAGLYSAAHAGTLPGASADVTSGTVVRHAHRTPPVSGEEIYQTTCAGCHAPDGRGNPQTTVGFDVPLPDFTDCNFATRETSADWAAIVRDGGPVRGFSRIMPAFRDLLTPDEIRSVVTYIHTFCQERGWPRGELNLPLADVTEKAFPEDELVLTGSAETHGPASIENHLIYEKRFGKYDQLELDTPFGFQSRPGSSWAGGLGDISVAEKHVFFSSLASGTILSGLGGLVLPTGDQSLGLGTGTTAFETYLLGAQMLPSRSFFQFQGGIEIPTKLAFAPRTVSWSGALGTIVPVGPITRLWSPMIEVAGSRDLVSGAETEWNVVPEFQLSLSALQHVRASVGVNVPLTQRGERHPQILFYVLWDTYDGPLFGNWKGWCPGCQH